MRILITFFLFIALAYDASSFMQNNDPKTAQLSVILDNIANTDGKIVIALFTNKKTWLRDGKAYISERIKFDSTRFVYTFNKLPIGKYAVAVYHDENTNGVFDRSFLGLPKESYGFSNNPKHFLPKPSFKSVAISFQRDTIIYIHLK